MLVYAPIAFLLTLGEMYIPLVLGFAVMMFLSTLPDIDIKISFIKHRGPTHTVWFAVVWGVLVGVCGGGIALGGAEFGYGQSLLSQLFMVGFGFFIGTLGILAHILGDVLTPMGIQPFSPYSDKKYTVNVTKAANKRANFLLWAVGALASFVAVYAGGRLATFV